MASLFRPENVIHIKYIVAVLVIKSIVFHTLARFRKDSARVSRRFIFEARIADAIRRWQVACEGLKRLEISLVCFNIEYDM